MKLFKKFVKFAVVGGIGACIQLGGTYLFTQKAHLYYMVSLLIPSLSLPSGILH